MLRLRKQALMEGVVITKEMPDGSKVTKEANVLVTTESKWGSVRDDLYFFDQTDPCKVGLRLATLAYVPPN